MADLPFAIPKTFPSRPAQVPQGVGLFMFGGVVLFVLSLLMWGGAYFYKQSIVSDIADINDSLKRMERDFEPPQIAELSKTAKTINSTKTLLAQHKSFSRIFTFLEENTLKEVSFSNFNFTSKNLSLTMSGAASGYSALAQQFAKLEDADLIQSVVLSNLSLLEQGTVGFSLAITFDQSILSFR